MIRFVFLLTVIATPDYVLALAAGQRDGMQHASGMSHEVHGTNEAAVSEEIIEGGQAAFVAMQEIVDQLMANPETDWSGVDIEALRQHLIDMDNVTIRAQVAAREIEGGSRFEATSEDPSVTASIRAMVPAHAATMNGVEGWTMHAEEIPGGAVLTVTGGDPVRIRALGFIGVMTVGMHHPAHHLALATGQSPHAH